MASYWERRRQAAQRRAFERSSGVRLPTGDTESSLADAEARRVAAGRRAQAEARVGATGPRARAEEMLPSEGLFAGSGTGRDFRVEPRTAEEQQRSRDLAEFVLFGPERGSVAGGEAGRLERFVRDWGLSEQEFRLAGERAGEGRAGAAAGWAALGLAGAVPFFGDVAQGLGRAGRVASQAADVGRAADAARVVPENIADNVIKEINTSGLQYTKPNIEDVVPDRRATAELAYRQGFEAPGRSLPSEDFERAFRELPQSVSRERLPFEPETAGQPIIVYRGLMDRRGVSGVDYGRSLIDGDYYVGHGVYGHGTYFSENFYDALNYSAIESGPSGSANGAIVRAVIPGDVRLLDFSNKQAQKAYQKSPFSTISEFAAANGYDGILIPKSGRNHVSMLNRSAMIFDSQPREVLQSDMIMLTDRRLTVPQIYEDLFRGGSNRQNVPQVQELPPEWEGLNF